MSRFNKISTILLGAAVTAGLVIALRIEAAHSLQMITLAPDTSHILTPLRPDGTVDYIAAINDFASQGVTPDNNAAVPLLLLSPPQGTPEMRKQLATALNAPELVLPQTQPVVYTPFLEFIARGDEKPVGALAEEKWEDKWDAEETLVESHPWSETDHPEAAAWMRAMQAPLDQITQAAAKPQFYTPLLRQSERTTVLTAFMSLGISRSCVDGLAARAMQRTHAGDIAGARSDALAMLRLAHLLGRAPILIEQSLAIGALDKAATIYTALLEETPLSPSDVAASQQETAGLWQLPAAENALDIGLRFELLDTFTQLARYGPDDGTGGEIVIDGKPAGPPHPAGPFAFGILPVHFDPILRDVNQSVDALVKAATLPRIPDRQREFDRVDAELTRRIAALGTPNSAQGRMNLLALQLCTGAGKSLRFHWRTQQQLNLLQAALAAREYYFAHPYDQRDVSALAKSLPQDPFTAQPFEIAHNNGKLTLRASQLPQNFRQRDAYQIEIPLP